MQIVKKYTAAEKTNAESMCARPFQYINSGYMKRQLSTICENYTSTTKDLFLKSQEAGTNVQ